MPSGSSSKVLFLDIRNVLLFFDREKMYRQIASYCGVNSSEVQKILEKHKWNESYETGEIDSKALFHTLPGHIQGSKGLPGWIEAISNVFTPNTSIASLIKILKQNHIKLFTLSNICEAHFAYAYTHFPVLHFFDGHVLSYEMKNRLPDSKMFEEALSKACSNKENTLYISASKEYVQKAKFLSMDSEVYESPEALFTKLKQKNYLP